MPTQIKYPLFIVKAPSNGLIQTLDIRAPGAFKNTIFTGQTTNLVLIQVTPQARGF